MVYGVTVPVTGGIRQLIRNNMEKIKHEVMPCINGSDHDFTKLIDTKEQTYYYEDGKSIRDHWIGKVEYLLCKKCGVDSRILNNPIFVVNEK